MDRRFVYTTELPQGTADGKKTRFTVVLFEDIIELAIYMALVKKFSVSDLLTFAELYFVRT